MRHETSAKFHEGPEIALVHYDRFSFRFTIVFYNDSISHITAHISLRIDTQSDIDFSNCDILSDVLSPVESYKDEVLSSLKFVILIVVLFRR